MLWDLGHFLLLYSRVVQFKFGYSTIFLIGFFFGFCLFVLLFLKHTSADMETGMQLPGLV